LFYVPFAGPAPETADLGLGTVGLGLVTAGLGLQHWLQHTGPFLGAPNGPTSLGFIKLGQHTFNPTIMKLLERILL